MDKWKIIDKGTRPNEKIMAQYTPGGIVYHVASGFLDRQGYVYKLYPVRYKSYDTINAPTTVSIFDVILK